MIKKKIAVLLAALLILSMLPGLALGATQVTLNISKSSAAVGDSITASGSSDPDEWVSIKVIDSNGSVVVYDAVKSDASGYYSYTFKVPQVAPGPLIVVAGYGSNVASKPLEITAEITLDRIEITQAATKTVYTVGDSLDISGLEITGYYSDNSSKKESISVANITGFDSTSPVKSQELTITFGGKTTSYTVEIKAASVSLNLSKSSATVGDSITASGSSDPDEWVSIKVLDSNGSIVFYDAVKSGANGNYSCTFKVPQVAPGTLTVVAGYGFNVASKPLEITTEVTLDRIEITNAASKLVYTVGESLDISGLEVTGYYSDNSSKVESITATNITGFDSTSPVESQVLTITVGGKTASYSVEIKVAPAPVTLDRIEITNAASKLVYTVGELLDISGMEVTGHYSDGSSKLESISTANISGFDSTSPIKSQELTITVGEKTTTYIVQIEEELIEGCFIATAAFGSKFNWPVSLLRHFRDQYLLTNTIGTAFVNFYYQNSPPIAAYIAKSEPLKLLVRVLLLPVIAIVYAIYHPVLFALIALIVVLLLYRRKIQAGIIT